MVTRAEVRQALLSAVPVMLAYVSIGIPCGVMEAQVGFTPLMAFLFSCTYYSGAGQFMVPNLWLAGTPLASIFLSVTCRLGSNERSGSFPSPPSRHSSPTTSCAPISWLPTPGRLSSCLVPRVWCSWWPAAAARSSGARWWVWACTRFWVWWCERGICLFRANRPWHESTSTTWTPIPRWSSSTSRTSRTVRPSSSCISMPSTTITQQDSFARWLRRWSGSRTSRPPKCSCAAR